MCSEESIEVDDTGRSGRFCVAFAGGSVPKVVGQVRKGLSNYTTCRVEASFQGLLQKPYVDRIEWAAWHVWFVDERCVPLQHADSNYRALDSALLIGAKIPESQVRLSVPTVRFCDASTSLLRCIL